MNYRSKIELHNVDCMEYMKSCKDKQFDLAIVDPPYGIGFSAYERGGSGVKTQKRHTKNGKKIWDSNIPSDEYFVEVKRISVNQIVFGGNYFEFLAKKENVNMKDISEFKNYIKNSNEKWLLWYKQNPVPNFADAELAWWSFNENIQFDFRYYGNIEGNTSASTKIHPTQKPVELYRWLLTNYAKEGDTIFDSHLGSGSIAIACDNLNFDLVGCEIDKSYFDDAVKRLAPYRKQKTLF